MTPSDIIGLDLGVRTGFAFGPVGATPESGIVILKREGEDASVCFANLLAFLAVRFDAGGPRLLAKESPMNLAGVQREGSGVAAVRMALGLHAVTEAVCVRFGIPWHNVADSTVRLHFTGRGRYGSRASTKAAVVARAHQLGYMDPGDADRDRADALAVWDWACANLARRPPRELVLFPPSAPAPPKQRRTA